jgi:hypothetical protein
MVARHKAKLISAVGPEACISDTNKEREVLPTDSKQKDERICSPRRKCTCIEFDKSKSSHTGSFGSNVPSFTSPRGHQRSTPYTSSNNEVNEQGRNDSSIDRPAVKEGRCLCLASSTVRLGVGGLFTARCDAMRRWPRLPSPVLSSRRCAVAVHTADAT